jgi:hypothetical protein
MAIASINPATGELLKSFEPLREAAIEPKLALAAAMFPKFRTLPFSAGAGMMSPGHRNPRKREGRNWAVTEMGETTPAAAMCAISHSAWSRSLPMPALPPPRLPVAKVRCGGSRLRRPPHQEGSARTRR